MFFPSKRHGQHFQYIADSQDVEDTRTKNTRDVRASFENMSLKRGRVPTRPASRIHLEEKDGTLISSMSEASRIMYMMRAPLFFEQEIKEIKDTTKNINTNNTNNINSSSNQISHPTISTSTKATSTKTALALAKYVKSLFQNDWIKESADKLSMGIVLCGRIIIFQISCRQINFTKNKFQTQNSNSKNNLAETTRYVLGCNIYMLVPRRGAASLSSSLSKELVKLKLKIKLFGFVVNNTSLRALDALSNDSDVTVLERLQSFRTYYKWNAVVFPRKLQTHTIVQRYLAMDVSKLAMTSVKHGIEITLLSLVQYIAQPERSSSVYGCSGRINSKNEYFIVFCPMQGTLSTAKVVVKNNNNNKKKKGGSPSNGTKNGLDGLDIFFVFDHETTIRESKKMGAQFHHSHSSSSSTTSTIASGTSSTSSTSTSRKSNRRGRTDQMPISSQAAAAKPWETTRMWLQRNLSVAAAHMLRDGLWTLARTTGLNKEQYLHLQRYVLKTSVHDIDSSLDELLDVFDDDMGTGTGQMTGEHHRFMHDFFRYMELMVPNAVLQCDGNRLFISNFNQALDIVFSTNGKLNVMLWRRRIGAAIGTIELELIRSFVLQFGSWLWSNGMER